MTKIKGGKTGKSSPKKSSSKGKSGKISRWSAIVTLVLLTAFVVCYIGQSALSGSSAQAPSDTPKSEKVERKSGKATIKKVSAEKKKTVSQKQKKAEKKEKASAKKLEQKAAKKAEKKRSGKATSVALANLNPERDLRPQFDYAYTAQVIEHEGYVVSYNADYKVPNWVIYELNYAETLGNLARKNSFAVDPEVPEKQMAQLSDYRNSGYDRGHMAPNADLNWSQQAQDESFYLSNMCPQGHDFNAGIWLDLENQVRAWAERDSAVTIVCGPVLPRTSAEKQRMKYIGKGKVIVPELFWKVVMVPFGGEARAIGFVMPNHNEKVGRKNRPLSDYAVSVDSVERLTGIDFFPALPDDIEEEIESKYNLKSWF